MRYDLSTPEQMEVAMDFFGRGITDKTELLAELGRITEKAEEWDFSTIVSPENWALIHNPLS